MPPEIVEDARAQADFDGPLVDYKSKGNTVDLVGTEAVDASQAYKLRVTLKNGTVRYMYLDTTSFLEVKSESTRRIQGAAIESDSRFFDYKKVAGVAFPSAWDNGIKGSPERQRMTIETIDVNVAIDDARFSIPSK
jgi:hypothetical protein